MRLVLKDSYFESDGNLELWPAFEPFEIQVMDQVIEGKFIESAGVRLSLSKITNFKNIRAQDFRKIRKARIFDLIQVLADPETDLSGQGFYCTNLSYNKNLLDSTKPSKDRSAFLVNMEDNLIQTLALDELETRFRFPGSTAYSSDKLTSIRNEYSNFGADSNDYESICFSYDKSDLVTYIVYSFLSENEVIVSFVKRDKNSLRSIDELIESSFDYLRERQVCSVKYFVSIYNISSIKMLNRLNFRLTNRVWNADV